MAAIAIIPSELSRSGIIVNSIEIVAPSLCSAGGQTSQMTEQAPSFVAPLAFNRRDVTRHRSFQHGFAVLGDNAVEIVTIDGLERERLQRCTDFINRARRQGYEIRVAPHE